MTQEYTKQLTPEEISVVASNDVKTHKTLGEFEADIATAEKSPSVFVETTDEIIKFFVNKGLKEGPGLIPMFNYKGVNVCRLGESQKCIDLMERQLGQIIHGPGEAREEGNGRR